MAARASQNRAPRRATMGGAIPARIGKYEVVRKLAEGGMAEIFLALPAEGSVHREPCVIKRMLPEIAGDPEYATMFLDEARIASAFDHPNLTRVFDVGTSDGGPFFVMELLSGQDVWHILRSSFARNEFIPYAQVVSICAGACAALHHAHELRDAKGEPLGIVHRDVSPHNLFVTHDGMTKLCDFGIAKSRIQQTQTRVGTWKGKARYMSPEQCRAAPVDRRSDVFALSIVLWEMLMLRRLYSGDSDHEVLAQVLNKEPPRPSDYRADVAPGLEAIVMKGLQPQPEDRFQTAAEMGDALEAWARSAGVIASQPGLALFMCSLFGEPAPTLDVLVERTTEADPLAKRVRDLGWFEAQASDLVSADKQVLLHLPGMSSLADLEPVAEEVTAAKPPRARKARRVEERRPSTPPLPPPPASSRFAKAPPRTLLLVALIACALGLGALWWRSRKPALAVSAQPATPARTEPRVPVATAPLAPPAAPAATAPAATALVAPAPVGPAPASPAAPAPVGPAPAVMAPAASPMIESLAPPRQRVKRARAPRSPANKPAAPMLPPSPVGRGFRD